MKIRCNPPKGAITVLKKFNKKHPKVINEIWAESELYDPEPRYWIDVNANQPLWFEGERTVEWFDDLSQLEDALKSLINKKGSN